MQITRSILSMQLGNMKTQVGRKLIIDVGDDTFNMYIREGGWNLDGGKGNAAENNQWARVSKWAEAKTFTDFANFPQRSVLLKAKEGEVEERMARASAFWKDIRKIEEMGKVEMHGLGSG